ncbi:MAG TPA: malate dehydrogenase (quinone) [Microbacteriaceae bacterium]|nr:malate dehydrogenase (quinone) [Microbacteriaceae bacterium]
MATSSYDVVLVGGGIMSATLGALIQRVQPDWSIRIFEVLGGVARESSNPWNNAGTGHSGLCELNYMPDSDGPLDPSKPIHVNEQAQLSRQFWASLVRSGSLPDPSVFLHSAPHMSFVRGKDNVDYLRRRYETLKDLPLFAGIEFADTPEKIAEWAPLLIEGRAPRQYVAATRSPAGMDVNFGALTKALFEDQIAHGAVLSLNTRVSGIKRRKDGLWRVKVRHVVGQTPYQVTARFVFVGAGGGALHLLQRTHIPEIKGYGGFPVSGKFFRTTDPALVAQHTTKVYGKAAVGAPPMSVPHLDRRVVDGQPSLLFGPYAGFSPKFLKNSTWLDLPRSLRFGNIMPMLAVARDNFALIKYLVGELLASRTKQLRALQQFVPNAKSEDWELITAGQRVQVIKKDKERGGKLQFGTEVITAADGSIAGLLGASPGASTAVPIMLNLLKTCFPSRYPDWEPRLKELVPTLGEELNRQPALAEATMAATAETLQIPA